MRDVARQLYADARLVPRYVDEYIVHTPRKEAVRAARQVCGVTHYLSLMATGDANLHKSALYGVGIACIDEVTDELGEELWPTAISKALNGDPTFESLEVLPILNREACDERFHYAVQKIGWAQDMSLAQFNDIDNATAERITRAKGGYSAKANLALVKDDISTKEWNFMERFGFTLQMLDDHLDRAKDEEAGLSTPFTEGFWETDDLEVLLDQTAEKAAQLWGESDAHERFFDICRLHIKLGELEYKHPGTASRVCPWYV